MRVSSRPLLPAAAISLGLILAACTQSINGRVTGPTAVPRVPSSAPATRVTPSPTPSASIAPARFVDCRPVSRVTPPPGLEGKLNYQCAQIRVPLDYADPNGSAITLQLLKVHDSDNTASTGSLLVNPGGPGGSAIEYLLGDLSQMKPAVMQHFDLLAFDPRGVGLSTPLSCISAKAQDTFDAVSLDVTTATGFAQAKAVARQFAQACNQKYGSTLQYFNTVNTAKDMDRVRAAVGDNQLNFLGFSYGTELGSVYAHLFPDQVRVAVLDGAVDPLTSGITQSADQLQGFEDAFDQFAASCRASAACAKLGNARQAVAGIQAAAYKHPLATSSGRTLTVALATTGVMEALYSRSLWTQLGTALIDARRGDGSGLLSLADEYDQRYADGQYSNLIQAFTAISCNDSKSGPSDSAIRATARRWVSEFPLFGRWSASSLFYCQQWQPVRTVPPKPTAATSTKVLVVGNLHDPATPYQGAKDLHHDDG